MKVLFNDLRPQWDAIKQSAMPELEDLLQNGPFISGKNVSEFEGMFASLCSTSYAIGVSNATDGLKLVIQSLGYPTSAPIMIPANGYISDALAASYIGHPIIPIDCDEYYNMDTGDLKKWIALYPESIIIPVHFYGQPCDMLRIAEIASEKATIIGDCSHAHGASIQGIPIGSFGIASVFSFYPTKNLGAMGDAGVIVTNNEKLYNNLKLLRDYGTTDTTDHIDYQYIGWNNRLDEMQALVLKHKLPYLGEWNKRRKEIASLYDRGFHNLTFIKTPQIAPYADGSVYYLYTIRVEKRNELREYLSKQEIQTLIRYPLPVHKMSIFRELENISCPLAENYSSEILSLPMHPFLTQDEIDYTILGVRNFFKCQ